MKCCKENDIHTELAAFNGCPYFVYYADRGITGGVVPEKIEDIEKVTEIRAFDENREIWFHRDALGIDFYCREINDTDADAIFDETQLLDIDTVFEVIEKDGKTTFTATGGGKYTLPVPADVNAVKVRNYLSFNKHTGRAEVCDFRILGFVKAAIEEVQ